MKSLRTIACLTALIACTLISEASAQQSADKTRRGDEYYLATAKMYLRHIYDHAQILHQYAVTGESIPDDVLNEHVREMRADLTSAKATFGKLSEKLKTDPSSSQKYAASQAKLKQIGAALDQLEQAAAELKDADAQVIIDLTEETTQAAKAGHAVAHDIHLYYFPDVDGHFDQGVFAN